MHTAYDFITMAIFAALIVLFLQRSTSQTRDPHPIWQYLVASAGCAVTNTVGNAEYHVLAILCMMVTIGYIALVLRPLQRSSNP